MNFKSLFAASAMMALASVFTMVGCGGDECTKAGDHIAECLGATDTGDTGDTGAEVECTGQAECLAKCVNAADCTAFSDPMSDAAKTYVECIGACTSGGTM